MSYLRWPVRLVIAGLLGLVLTGSAFAYSQIFVPAGPSTPSQPELNQPDLPAKTIVLTFDDGPSSYTPQVLAVLKQKQVHATFFVIGSQAIQTPLLSKIYNSGNEIGNHTYTHPDLENQPKWRLMFELNITRIIIESQTRHDTRLFRPPYLGSDDPPTNAIDLIGQVGNLGYITVGSDIDTNDWRRPGVKYIVATAESNSSSIILFHDGGGDRHQTVDALPQVIDYYKARGFHFDTLSEALGVSRDQVMPPLSLTDAAIASVSLVVFTLWDWINWLIKALIILVIVASFVRVILVSATAIVQSRRRSNPPFPDPLPLVSVIIPAYNEQAVIESCIHSILETNYSNLEVLAVDDGSTDSTASHAASIQDERLQVLSKPNGGKARALNFGIRHSHGEIIIAIDADSVFNRHTIPRLIRHFSDPRVGAVSGNTKIVNQQKLITKLQSLEYIIGFNLDRRMGDLFDCITVVPGAIGAFRREALYQVGGFRPDTLAEDTDLTIAIKETGAKIVYDDRAVAYTEAPSTLDQLLKQRYRWTFGTMQAVFKHRRSIFKRSAGTLGLVGLPYLLFYQILFPLMSPFFDLSLVIGLLTHQYHLVVISFVVFTILDLSASVLAFKLDGEPVSGLWILVPQRLIYRQLMYYVLFHSLVRVLKGQLVLASWDIKRDGLRLADQN
jgi:peptidoglycan-N-acetylglucosamine deacetylase